MSNLHNIQKSLADRLNAEFEDNNGTTTSHEAENEKIIIGLAEKVQEKEQIEASQKAADKKLIKKSPKPVAIALVMLAFAAVIFAGETLL